MKNVEYFLRAKKALREELGEKFPKNKSELTRGFLRMFGGCFEGATDEDCEEAYYSSDRWNYFDKKAEAEMKSNWGADEEAWNEYLDYFVDAYFPEWKTTRIS